jgi:hypothetical protein
MKCLRIRAQFLILCVQYSKQYTEYSSYINLKYCNSSQQEWNWFILTIQEQIHYYSIFVFDKIYVYANSDTFIMKIAKKLKFSRGKSLYVKRNSMYSNFLAI